MNNETKHILQKIANTVRILSMDAIQKADSGHPGLPLGCAELGAYLWGEAMHYLPSDPDWLNRDRFVLSAGHGCMLQYSLLHLAGYDLSLDQIKHFRQLHSKTPGHPEFGHTVGIEATTGPLGQGVANAVGMALGMKILAKKFNTDRYTIFNNKIFCLAGDGCIMEGISSEASSLAGHLGLDNFILLYDSNQICLDGPLKECCSEDTKLRYKSYGFEVFEIDGYDFDAMKEIFNHLRKEQTKPAIIIVHTIIGKGSPHKSGSHNAHGSPLGPDEVKATKEELGLSEEEFYIPQTVLTFFEQRREKLAEMHSKWQQDFDLWSKDNPKLYQEFEKMLHKKLPSDIEMQLRSIPIEDTAGRSASHKVINYLANIFPFLYGGSADLSGSDKTMMEQFALIAPKDFSGRNIKFGVREFAMAAMAAGLFRTQMMIPFCGTFLTFSDYMRNAIRLAALSKYQVIYQFTHDSIFLGEDGPTHQPIEHYASLRAMPNLHFMRPADAHEIKMCWLAALRYQGPTAIALTRQKLPNLSGTNVSFDEGVGRGGYIVLREQGRKPDFTLFATGSELSLAVDVAKQLQKLGKQVRVISMPCWAIFEEQDDEYKESIVGGDLGKRVSIEAGVDLGWHKYIGRSGIAISMESFGASAPASVLKTEFGFNPDSILERILNG